VLTSPIKCLLILRMKAEKNTLKDMNDQDIWTKKPF